MRVLVTGGAGFIGSNYVEYLIRNTGDSVTTLDALTYAGSRDNLSSVIDHPRHEFVLGDIRDQELVDELVERVDAVLNFAAETHVDRSIRSSEPFVATNVEGTQTLLEAALDTSIERFIQVSTDEVYGEILEGKFGENDPLDPRNPYAATKAGADLLARSYYTTYGLPILVTRSSNNYGPRQHPEKLIPKLISRAVSGKSLPIYGDGSNVREWIYVEENCRAIDLVLREGDQGEVYNVGSSQELSNIEVAERVLDIVDAPRDLIEFVDDRLGHDQRYALDTEKISALGWEPKWSFEEGLNRTVDYYTT